MFQGLLLLFGPFIISANCCCDNGFADRFYLWDRIVLFWRARPAPEYTRGGLTPARRPLTAFLALPYASFMDRRLTYKGWLQLGPHCHVVPPT